MSHVLDASAVLAFVRGEPGAEVVAPLLSSALVSAVNVAEVMAVLIDKGWAASDARRLISGLGPRARSFDESLAIASGALRQETRRLGLSLGDRACLALAMQERLTAVTADRAWSDLDLDVEVVLIR